MTTSRAGAESDVQAFQRDGFEHAVFETVLNVASILLKTKRKWALRLVCLFIHSVSCLNVLNHRDRHRHQSDHGMNFMENMTVCFSLSLFALFLYFSLFLSCYFSHFFSSSFFLLFSCLSFYPPRQVEIILVKQCHWRCICSLVDCVTCNGCVELCYRHRREMNFARKWLKMSLQRVWRWHQLWQESRHVLSRLLETSKQANRHHSCFNILTNANFNMIWLCLLADSAILAFKLLLPENHVRKLEYYCGKQRHNRKLLVAQWEIV